MARKKKELTVPTIEELEQELQRERYKKRYRRTLRSTVGVLVTVAAVAILIATLLLPVLQDLRDIDDTDADGRRHRTFIKGIRL